LGARLLRRYESGGYYEILGIGSLLALAMFGGASRPDELQQLFIRGAAILAIAAALWPLDFSVYRDGRGPVLGLALVYLLLLAQLVPLPPAIWQQMPGHAIYADIARQTDSVVWRPWTISPDLTLNSLAALLPATAIGLIAMAIDFKGRLLLARVLVGIACASALLGLLQFAAGGTTLHLFRTTSEDSAVGLFANRNHQAAFLACALPIGGALAAIRAQRQGISRRNLAIDLSAALLLLMGLGVTGSRMGLLLGLIGAIAAGLIISMTVRASPRTPIASGRMRVAIGAVSLVGLLAFSAFAWRGGALSRLAGNAVDQTRVAALAPMLSATRVFFPFGAGFGTFDPVFRRFEPETSLSTIYLNQAHNEPVQLAIEGGIPALLLLLLFLIWWARAALRAMRPRSSGSRRALGAAMVAVTLVLMLSSLVDYPLRTPLLSGLFALACVELLRARPHTQASHHV
jgi:O-antigen ligase